MIDREGFSFVIGNYVIGYEKGDGFCFGKMSPFEKMVAKDIARKLESKQKGEYDEN